MLSKMVSGTSESQVCQKSLEIKQDDKFFTRIMSKDTSIANSSSRVYYGGASSSIPFVWESSPGTPKHPSFESSIPPLTPPPSYFSRSRSRSKSKSKFRENTILPKFITTSRKKTTHISPSSSMSSSTTTTSGYSNSNSSSSWSSSRTPFADFSSRKSLCFSCSSSSIHDNEEEEKIDDVVDKDDRRGSCSGSSSARVHHLRVSKGWFWLKNLKSSFFTIVGYGSI